MPPRSSKSIHGAHMPASERPTVTRFAVRSNRDGEIVVGPLDTRKQADDECTRLGREQMRNWLTNGETTVGDPIEPPGYRVEPIEVPDPEARRAELKAELDRIGKDRRKKTAPEGLELDEWHAVLDQDSERIESELADA